MFRKNSIQLVMPLIFTMFLSAAFSQETTGVIRGTVRDGKTGGPILGVEVVIEGTDLRCVTNNEGNYIISNIPLGLYKISFIAPGFKKEIFTNLLLNDTHSEARIDINLIEDNEYKKLEIKENIEEEISESSTEVSQGYTYFVTGYQISSLLGNGISDDGSENHFKMGRGFIVEWGALDVAGNCAAFGGGAFWTTNMVGESEAKAAYYIPVYFDYRRYFLKSNVKPCFSLGIGWGRLHFSETKGSNDQLVLSTGAGIHFRFGGGIIQFMAKPFWVFKNDMKQRSGIETHLSIGFGG